MRVAGKENPRFGPGHRSNYRKRTEDARIRVSDSVLVYQGFLLG